MKKMNNESEIRTIKLRIRESVLFAEKKINQGQTHFFLDTEFGKIGMEVNPSHEINPNHSALVVPWILAPETTWTKMEKESADIYASVDLFGPLKMDHQTIIEVFIRSIFLNMELYATDDIIDAGIKIYLKEYEFTSYSIQSLINEYLSSQFNVLARKNLAIKTLVKELLTIKNERSEMVINNSDRLISFSPIMESQMHDKFSYRVFGLILYTRKQNGDDLKLADEQIRNNIGMQCIE